MRKFSLVVVFNLVLFLGAPFWNCGGSQEPPTGQENTTTEATDTDGGGTSVADTSTTPGPEPSPTWEPDPSYEPEPQGPTPNTPLPIPEKAPEGLKSMTIQANDVALGETETDKLHCMVVDNPSTSDQLLRRFEVMLDQSKTVRRMVLSLDTGAKAGEVDCSAQDNPGFGQNLTPIYVWVPGTDAFQFPENGGILIKPNQRLRLTIVYNNTTGQSVKDKSGLKLFYDKPADKAPRYMLWTRATASGSLQSGQEASLTSACDVGQKVTMVAGVPYLGPQGSSYLAEIIRQDGAREELVRYDDWKAGAPLKVFAFPHVLNPGDKLLAHCSWYNRSSKTIRSGWKANEESCELFTYILQPTSPDICQASTKPGKCAPKDGLKDTPSVPVTVTFEKESDPFKGYDGGENFDAVWKFDTYDLAFEPTPFSSYLKQDGVFATGQVKTGSKVHVDLKIDVALEFGGSTYPYSVAISFSGTPKPRETPGQFTLEFDCKVPNDIKDTTIFFYKLTQTEMKLGFKYELNLQGRIKLPITIKLGLKRATP